MSRSLGSVAFYPNEKISAKDVLIEDFITVDNLLPNKSGRVVSEVEPAGQLTKFKAGDTLVGNIRPYLRKIWFADYEGACTQDILAVRPKAGVDPRFLYYSLFRDDFFVHMMKGAKGTKMPRGDRDHVMTFEVPEFDRSEEKEIAGALSVLDAKIELNKRINSELERMAKTLYEYWFVQFDFPDFKGKPYKSSGGTMRYHATLNEEIPDGWTVSKMSDWIRTDKSGDWGKETAEGNFTQKVNCIRGADIDGLKGLRDSTPPVRFILHSNAGKILKSHDLIIEISGGSPTQSTGRLAYVTESTLKRFDNPIICSNFCKALVLKDYKLFFNFIYHWNSLYDNGAFFGYEGKTSGIKNLLFDSFVNSYNMVVPEQSVAEKFYYLMTVVDEKKQIGLAENQRLSALRDWLLPMLMNGQVTVGGVG